MAEYCGCMSGSSMKYAWHGLPPERGLEREGGQHHREVRGGARGRPVTMNYTGRWLRGIMGNLSPQKQGLQPSCIYPHLCSLTSSWNRCPNTYMCVNAMLDWNNYVCLYVCSWWWGVKWSGWCWALKQDHMRINVLKRLLRVLIGCASKSRTLQSIAPAA